MYERGLPWKGEGGGSVQCAKAEIELLQQVELARKFMIAILWESTDRSSLQRSLEGTLRESAA